MLLSLRKKLICSETIFSSVGQSLVSAAFCSEQLFEGAYGNVPVRSDGLIIFRHHETLWVQVQYMRWTEQSSVNVTQVNIPTAIT